MGRSTFAVAVALITLVAFTASTVEARHGKSAGNAKSKQTQTVGNADCPLGNTPGSGLSRGIGPGDCTGNQGAQRRDGSGYGAQAQGKGKANNPNCDGAGPKGSAKGRKATQP